jgi:Tfp pilus tip-associated adhesin PilY1
MTDMGFATFNPTDVTLATRTVKFLRGGETTSGSANGIGRDEILNQVKPVSIPKIDPVTNPQFSYYYQDDIPPPGTAPPQTGNPTDGGATPPGYPHKLGDIFHSEAIVVEPPRYFQYLSGNLTPPGTTTPQPYLDFTARHAKRRRVIYVGSNDGFLHAFDAGVFNGDTTNLPNTFDLGSGRELFAYSPREAFGGGKFQSLLEFSPQPQYFVDGSMAHADVFIDPEFDGGTGPDPAERVWRTVLVGGLRQGGSGYYALDVTQPDNIDETTTNPTYGEMIGAKTSAPGCLDGTGSSCTAGATSSRQYPAVLWEFSDKTAAPCSDGCGSGPGGLPAPALGETWSRPVIGRVKVITDPILNTFEDRYVAFVGGGFDPSLDAADDPVDTTVGRAFYMIDVETGKILFKTSEGLDGNGSVVSFGPMPAPPAAADYNDDGYIDVVYIGDTRGRMWRINVTPDTASGRGVLDSTDGQLHNYTPFELFDSCRDVSNAFQKAPPKSGKNCVQPIFFEPGIVYLGGASAPPALGIAFGTGDRSELTRSAPSDGGSPPNFEKNSFYYVIDGGSTATTMGRNDLIDLTLVANGGTNPCQPYDPAVCGLTGFVLDYETDREKTTTTVFSTLGELSVLTYTPDSPSACATNGNSFRYRFFYLSGQPGYTTTSNYGGYREDLAPKFASAGQSVAPNGDIIDTILYSQGIRQDVTPATLQTIQNNWKEQQ